MDYSLVNSKPYQEALTLFPEQDPYQTDVLKQTLSQGETAGMRAKTDTLNNLSQQGFGHNTFGNQLGTIAQAKATQPYIQSAIQAAESMKQQRLQNFMNMLNAGIGYNTQQQLLEQERKKKEMDWFNALLDGGLTVASIVPGPWQAPAIAAKTGKTMADGKPK